MHSNPLYSKRGRFISKTSISWAEEGFFGGCNSFPSMKRSFLSVCALHACDLKKASNLHPERFYRAMLLVKSWWTHKRISWVAKIIPPFLRAWFEFAHCSKNCWHACMEKCQHHIYFCWYFRCCLTFYTHLTCIISVVCCRLLSIYIHTFAI